jgi:hypothetical protein
MRARRSLVLLVCLLLCAPAASLAQTAIPAPAAVSPSSARADLPSELASFFPADTEVYLEAHRLGAIFDSQPGSLEQVYEMLPAFLKAGKGDAETKLPVTIDEVRTLLASDVALGTGMGGRPGFEGMLVVLRTPSADAAAMVRDRLLPLLLSSFPEGRKTETVGGQSISLLAATNAPDAPTPFAYAVAKETVVVGGSAAVRALFDPAARDAATLASAPAFADARKRLSGNADTFGWIDLLSSMSDPGRSADPASVFRGLRGLAFAGTEGRTELLVEVDRSKDGVVTTIADAPSIDARAAALVPPDFHAMASFGFEAARVYDALAEYDAKIEPREGSRDTALWARSVEERVGMRAREEFLAALGGRMAVAFDFTPMLEAVKTSGFGAGAPHALYFVDTTQPEVARRALVRYFSSDPKTETESVREGVVVAHSGTTACAVVDGTAVVGEERDVERALDARRSGDTLLASPRFAALRERLASNTVAALYVSPDLGVALFDAIRRAGAVGGAATADASTGAGATAAALAPIVVTANKEDLGIYVSSELPSAAGFSVLGIAAGVAIPSLLRARGAANESSAIGTLRSIASAEATYRSHHGRYATMPQLVAAGMLDRSVADGVRNGYRFRQVEVTAETFEFAAEPTSDVGSDRAFNVSGDFIIRYATGAIAPKGTTGKVLGAE